MNNSSKLPIVIAAMFVFLIGACRADDSAPVIEYRVTMPKEMKKTLEEYYPDFKVWDQSDFAPVIINDIYVFSAKQTPSTVIADFNGDGVKDIALFGYDNTHMRVICIMSNGIAFRAFEIVSYELKETGHPLISSKPETMYSGVNTYLIYSSPGIVDSPHEETSLVLKTDAFEIVHFECSSRMIYFQDETFHEYWTAD
ncbi:MAG TPA: hypothetical protein PKH33_03425 [bacterium]|nr:hypothetical protein [bacterium]